MFSHLTIFCATLVFLSPKRAMRQLCSLLSHNAQPLGTCRHLLAQMDAILFLFNNFSNEIVIESELKNQI